VPIVSVIIPAYNAEAFIAETIESVLAQTLTDIEVLVIDDGSRDGTAAVVQAFPQVRYVHKANGGVSAARNLGAELAKGEFLAFLDSDDIWHPDKLRQQVQALREHPDSDLSRTALATDPQSLANIKAATASPPAPATGGAPHRLVTDFRSSFLAPYFATSTVMVRRSAFMRAGGFDSKRRIAEDVDFYLRLLAPRPQVVYMTDNLLYKRPVEGSLGDDSAAGYVQLIDVYERFLLDHPQVKAELGAEVVNQAFYQLRLALARSHLWVGDNQEARAAAWSALRHGAAGPVLPLLIKSCLPAGIRHRLGSKRTYVHH
jgi:glycosyltransferase involved in cell wall biosynthesis